MSKVAIAGFGVEGQAAYRYFSAQGDQITILDEKPIANPPSDAEVKSGADAFNNLDEFDLILRAPSIRPDRLKTAKKITTGTKEFFAHCPAKIIGVTGTKGKGTTASLIELMLKKAGFKTHLVGNIGVPALDELPKITAKDVVVYELSSYQLWDLAQSPQIAVVLMMEPEHLDIHKDVVEYTTAKSNISNHQSPDDVIVYLPGNKLTEQTALNGDGQKIPYTRAPGAYQNGSKIVIDNTEIIDVKELPLPGKHNVDNACAAVTAVWQLTQDAQAIAAGLKEFKGLDHRLKFVAEVRGVKYFDDSFATTPGSAIAALNAFAEPKVIILGGSDKGADFEALAQEVVSQNDSVRAVILIGQMQDRLYAAFKEAGLDDNKIVKMPDQPTMSEIVKAATQKAQSRDIIILSPACASLDMFKSYKDRGEQFIAAVKNLT